MRIQKQKNRSFIVVCGSMLALTTALVFSDTGAAGGENKHYCEMVHLWELDATAGIPEQKRNGWPNYKNAECGE